MKGKKPEKAKSPPATACPHCGTDRRVYLDLVAACQGVRSFVEEIAAHPDAVLTDRGACLLRWVEATLAKVEGAEPEAPVECPARGEALPLFAETEDRAC
jgi:hypothetical protein